MKAFESPFMERLITSCVAFTGFAWAAVKLIDRNIALAEAERVRRESPQYLLEEPTYETFWKMG